MLKQATYPAPFAIVGTDLVDAKIGSDLQGQAVRAVLYALGGMLIYIAFRFEWIYGVAAVVAVFHDTIITIGLFSLFNKEISLTVVAALLTLVGYSMNDTIVVFDRIRENLKILRREPLESVINRSVNQTLSRTVLDVRTHISDGVVLVAVWRTGASRIFLRAGCRYPGWYIFVCFCCESDLDFLAELSGEPQEARRARGSGRRSERSPGSCPKGNCESEVTARRPPGWLFPSAALRRA